LPPIVRIGDDTGVEGKAGSIWIEEACPKQSPSGDGGVEGVPRQYEDTPKIECQFAVLLETGVLCFRLFEDRKIGIGVLPESQEVVVG
jgi:hypothetical protein